MGFPSWEQEICDRKAELGGAAAIFSSIFIILQMQVDIDSGIVDAIKAELSHGIQITGLK